MTTAFRNFSTAFRNFSETYYALLGGSEASPEQLAHMYKEYVECPTAGSIESFIRKSKEFSDKHAKLISDIFDALTVNDLQRPPPPPAHTTKLWVNRFIYDSTYNVEKLRDDLMSYISKTVVVVVDVNSTNFVNNDLIGLVGLHGIDSTSQQQPATVTVDDVTIMSPDVEYHVIDVEYVEEFEKVFGRAMYVEEYFFYKNIFRAVGHCFLD